jgi:hypothetical protein
MNYWDVQLEGGGHGGQGSGQALVIMYTNAEHIGKVNERYAADTDQDLILLTETWCNSDVSDYFLIRP